METRYRTAGNGDEQEREQAAFPDRAGAIGELGQRGHFQLGHGDQNADCQGNDGADFQEGRQVVTGCQYQPHRQHCRNKAITDQHPGDLRTGKGEHRRPLRARRNLAPQPDGTEQQQHADNGDFTDAARADVAHVNAHKHRDRDGCHHRKHAPRAFGQGLDHDQRQHREDDDHDQEAAEQRDGPWNAAHLFAHHIPQGTAVTTGGQEQDHEVLHRTGQHHPGNQPEGAGQIAHLRRQHRADQRACTGNRRKVVTEKDVFVGRHIVQTVVIEHRRRCAAGVQLHHLGGDKQAVITVSNQINGNSCHNNPQGVDRLAPAQCHYAKGAGSYNCQHQPRNVA